MSAVLGVIVIFLALVTVGDLADALAGQPASIVASDDDTTGVIALVVIGGLLLVGGFVAAFIPARFRRPK